MKSNIIKMNKKLVSSCNLRVGLSRNYKSNSKETSANVNTSVKELKTSVNKVVMLSPKHVRVGLSRNYKSNSDKQNFSVNFDASPSYSPLDGKFQTSINKAESKNVNKSLFKTVSNQVSLDISNKECGTSSLDGNFSENIDNTLNESQINTSNIQKEPLNRSVRKPRVSKVKKNNINSENNQRIINNFSGSSELKSEKKNSDESVDEINQGSKRNTKRRTFFDEDTYDNYVAEDFVHNASEIDSVENYRTKKSKNSVMKKSKKEQVVKMDIEETPDRTEEMKRTRNRKQVKYFVDDSCENEVDDKQEKKAEILKKDSKEKINDNHKVVIDINQWVNFESIVNGGVLDRESHESTSEILENNSQCTDKTFKNGKIKSDIQSGCIDVEDSQEKSRSVEVSIEKPSTKNSTIHVKSPNNKVEKIETSLNKPSKNKLSLKRKTSSFQSVESSPEKLSKWSQDSPRGTYQVSLIKNNIDTPSSYKENDQTKIPKNLDEYSETCLEELKNTIKCKRMKLEDLQRAELYHKMHDVKNLVKLTKTWKSGCQNALSDLLNKVREHDENIQMPSLLNNLGITAEFVDYSVEEEDFV